MTERVFRQGDQLVRTGVSLPHLGVHSGQIYEVEDYDGERDGLFLKGVAEGLDPASFQPADL
ncbi:hypothetical protein [Caulobacter sp.]|uniref:hypothetical protein n=1 Tax=Caulobacter sp. TaxID=78 RepID=UPI0031DDB625